MANNVARIHKDDDPEKIMLKQAVTDLRKFISDQGMLVPVPSLIPPLCNAAGTMLDKLDADLALYRKAFNQRILYFRQLQEISDSVSDPVFENTVAQALQECANEQRDLAAKVGPMLLDRDLWLIATRSTLTGRGSDTLTIFRKTRREQSSMKTKQRAFFASVTLFVVSSIVTYSPRAAQMTDLVQGSSRNGNQSHRNELPAN
jgi:hypothetical protein